MNNEYYYRPDPPHQDPPVTYRTGSTQPPKSKNGLIAFLLIAVIILIGAVTLLGVMNVRLFRQLNGDTQGEMLNISLSNTPSTADAAQETTRETRSEQVDTVEVASTPTAPEQVSTEGELSLQQIYSNCIDSVVSISCVLPNGSSTGTGVVLTADGYIVTNCHVVENAYQIQILFQDDRVMDAQLVGADSISDLAVLWVDAEDLPYAQLGDSSVLRVGDTVVAIGDPLGTELRGTMTNGIVSAINRDVNVDGRVMNLIQTNAALNSGNSGGPLINSYGQVIGINTMKMGDSMSIAGVEGLGFAIPSNTVSTVVNQLISQGYVSGRPSLGIGGEDVSDFYRFYYGLPAGVYITQVAEGSPADQAGLRSGDILLGIGNARITGVSDYETVLYSLDPGDSVTITIYRNGRQYTATLTVGEANS